MLKVGITGGIGSGKTIVCQVFETLGIPVFYADNAAKSLMENDKELITNIKKHFGEDIYINQKLNREKLSNIVFGNREKLHLLNSLVHPATIKHGKDWMERQTSPYIIKEAAILFESGSNKDLDLVIGVFAPKELRIKRVMNRDHITREKVEERMNKQMDEDEKMQLCNFVIVNDDQEAIIPQVLKIHERLMKEKQFSSN